MEIRQPLPFLALTLGLSLLVGGDVLAQGEGKGEGAEAKREPVELWTKGPDGEPEPFRDYWHRVKGLQEGDVVRFPEGDGFREFRLGKSRGGAKENRIFSLPDHPGRAIRITTGRGQKDPIESFLQGYEELKDQGLSIVRVHGGVPRQYAIVEELPEGMLSFQSMVKGRDLERGQDLAPGLREKMRASFVEFMADASRFQTIGDFHHAQMGYLPEEGRWVLYDWHSGNRLTRWDRRRPAVVEDFFHSLLHGTHSLLDWSPRDMEWMSAVRDETLAAVARLDRKEFNLKTCARAALRFVLGRNPGRK